jgi:hydroxymethyl cephem carbamoyltransferase
MALAAYSTRGPRTKEEDEVIYKILNEVNPPTTRKNLFAGSPYLNCTVTSPAFTELAGKFSDVIFDTFHSYARGTLTKGYPLLISGGCGLNCEWNTKWLNSGLFADVFVPPVTNDSGIAIGTAVEAQYAVTGNAKVKWSVYSGLEFDHDVRPALFDESELDVDAIAKDLAEEKIVAWVQGRFEIGPRALGNRSILASPFSIEMRDRLNQLKKREYYRPVAPVCLEDDARIHFGLHRPSPHMLYFQRTLSTELRTVTHIDGTARVQTVSPNDNLPLVRLLEAFKRRTGFGVLCNTSLNFPGRGFINRISDLCKFASMSNINILVVGEKVYRRSDSLPAIG